MTSQLESIGSLERRLTMVVPLADVDKEVGERLKRLARTVRMPGFRPGKVPLKIIAQQYEPQVRGEVVRDAVQKAFNEAIQGHNLRVAGFPRFEPGESTGSDALLFNATFEVYPEVTLGDIAALNIARPTLAVGTTEVDRTIESIRKQRAAYAAVERGAQEGDRLTLDFNGTLDGADFPGGSGSNVTVILGEGRLLADFESGLKGAVAGETREFDVVFPAAYSAKELAGKTARFTASVKAVEEARFPEVDAEFARTLGVADGDLEKMRAEIKENVEREVSQRLSNITKQRVMQGLLETTAVDAPKSLVDAEIARLVEGARSDLRARGIKAEEVPVNPELFRDQALRRVKLGLIVAECIKRFGLAAKPDQVRKLVEESARTFEQPFEVIKWVYSQPDRLAEFEGMAVEENVVRWALENARVNEVAVAFDELMGAGTSA